MVRERSGSADIPLLARRTEISQEAEIETIENWLTVAADASTPRITARATAGSR